MKKKLLAFLTSLFIVTVTASAEVLSAVNNDGVTIYYEIMGNNAWVAKNESGGYSGDVSIPSVVTLNGNEYPVTDIWYDAFMECSGLISVEIPASVTGIGSRTFYNCKDLRSVKLPETVTSIDGYAFYGCVSLTDLEIPSSLEYLGMAAFEFCSSLTSVKIPASITSLNANLFGNCSGLTSVELPGTLTWISESVFWGCSGLTTIDIPSSVTYIGESAFKNCTGLTSIKLPESLDYVANSAFLGCKSLTSVKIPASATSISSLAFYECGSLASVEIPASVTSIWDLAFYECGNLSSLTVLVPNPDDIYLGGDIFAGVNLATCTLYVPRGSKDRYAAANIWKGFAHIEELSDLTGVREVEDNVAGNRFTVCGTDGGLQLTGTDANQMVGIYSVSGQLLYSGMSTAGVTVIPFDLAHGTVYIIKVGGESVKYIHL